MTDHVAIVTGGLSGLGHAMALGLARNDISVVAAGHIAKDAEAFEAAARDLGVQDRVEAVVADLRTPAECDRLVSVAEKRFGYVDILVNNAGLTFVYITPERTSVADDPPFWEISDDIVANVMQTNYMIADMLTRRLAPKMVARKWGRIVNVTTKYVTMSRRGASAYGSSKAALEMASEIWAKDMPGAGVTLNVLNPGKLADTPGVAPKFRESRKNSVGDQKLLAPEEMVPPLLWLVSHEADHVNGLRFDASAWDPQTAPSSAMKEAIPVGLELHRARM